MYIVHSTQSQSWSARLTQYLTVPVLVLHNEVIAPPPQIFLVSNNALATVTKHKALANLSQGSCLPVSTPCTPVYQRHVTPFLQVFQSDLGGVLCLIPTAKPCLPDRNTCKKGSPTSLSRAGCYFRESYLENHCTFLEQWFGNIRENQAERKGLQYAFEKYIHNITCYRTNDNEKD